MHKSITTIAIHFVKWVEFRYILEVFWGGVSLFLGGGVSLLEVFYKVKVQPNYAKGCGHTRLGVAGGRCSLLGGGRSLEVTNTWC